MQKKIFKNDNLSNDLFSFYLGWYT